MKLNYIPNFFAAAKAFAHYSPDIARAYSEGVQYGLANNLATGDELIKRGVARLIALTDLEEDFRDDGRLPVKGTDQVVLRVCERIINGVVEDYYGGIMYSLDGHPFDHISFDCNWRDGAGDPLNLEQYGKAAILTLEDPVLGTFKAQAFSENGPYDIGTYRHAFDPMGTVAYWNHLQATGQGPIWVFVPHCVIGTDGANLHPLLAETIAFACGVRRIRPRIIRKGHLANTDWFGPLEPCKPSDPEGLLNMGAVAEMTMYAAVEFGGVAEDFCEYNMRAKSLELLAGLGMAGKMRFLRDCTAPIVPNAAHVAALYDRARAAGIQFIDHDAPLDAGV
ncbi:MAG TPA: hypothetical protein VFT82_04395 [Candidatus Paceibacterota bacterium]|nr:hypothetical protein [Candidatus Paceibacterota bacterium]